MSRAHEKYFTSKVVYYVNCVDRRLDHVDQRVHQDIKEFTELIAMVLTQLLTVLPILLVYTVFFAVSSPAT